MAREFATLRSAMPQASRFQDEARAVETAVAQQRLEGIEVDEETVRGLFRVARGELTIDEVLEDLHRRIQSGAFNKPAA